MVYLSTIYHSGLCEKWSIYWTDFLALILETNLFHLIYKCMGEKTFRTEIKVMSFSHINQVFIRCCKSLEKFMNFLSVWIKPLLMSISSIRKPPPLPPSEKNVYTVEFRMIFSNHHRVISGMSYTDTTAVYLYKFCHQCPVHLW